MAANVFDGAEVEMAGVVVGGVDRGFFRADVVRPDRDAGVLGALRHKPAACEEIDEGGCGRVYVFV